MCDLEVTSLIKNLSAVDVKGKIDPINELVESFKNKEHLRNDIIVALLKNLGSIVNNRKEILECFRWILESMDKSTLEYTISQLKEHLYQNKIKDATKGQLSINKLGSILAFDALFTSIDITKIEKTSFNHFYKFVLSLVNDNLLGFLASATVINFFKKISIKEFQSALTELNDEIFSLENVGTRPQYLLFWLAFSDEQKKLLKSSSKTVPSIQAKDVLSKLSNIFKSFRDDQLKTVLNYLAVNNAFPVVWKHLCDTISQPENHLKLKHVLLMAFETVCPQPSGAIDRLSPAKRLALLNKVWGNEQIVNLLIRQLSHTEFDLHAVCQRFVSDIVKIDINTTNDCNVLEQLFQVILSTLGAEFVNQEAKINQSARLSHVLLRHIKSATLYTSYIDLLQAYFKSTEKCHQKVYALEQLSAAFVKCPARNNDLIEMLLSTNYNYNHKQTGNETALTEAARSALLRCLEAVGIDNLDKSKELLTIAMPIYDTEELHDMCEDLLKLWTATTATKPKKRRASEQHKITVDLADKTNATFVGLLANLCLYMGSQPLDAEMLEIVDDINTCLNKYRGQSSSCADEVAAPTPKRSKAERNGAADNEQESNESWSTVLTDVLIVLLEQSCHYLRTIAMAAFKSLVVEGHCDVAVIEHITATIERAETQVKDIDKKHDKEDQNLSEAEASDGDASEESSEDDEDQMEVDKDSDLKARIFAALGSVMADVHSDSDDNCPEIDEPEESSDEENENNNKGEQPFSKPKVSLKEKRHTVLQLRQFRIRCIDLLDTIFQHSPQLEHRLEAFLALLCRTRKSDSDIETRLLRSTQSFKKFQPTGTVSTEQMIGHIKRLTEGVQQCNLSKNVIQIIGGMLVTFLRMKKDDLAVIVDSFKATIEQCVTEKKKHPLKAVFLGTFDVFPEISWAFHQPMLNYVHMDQPEQVQFQAIGILRKIITNPTIKSIVCKTDNADAFVSKSEILLFVNKFGAIIRSIVMALDLQKRPMYSALIIGSLIDCLKLGGHSFYQTIEPELYDKVKATQKPPKVKYLKKPINQFMAAVDCAKKSVV